TLARPAALPALLPPRLSRFRPGDRLPGRPDWRLAELLGTGGFGEVWLARKDKFDLRWAVKFCTDLTEQDRRVLLHEGEIITRVRKPAEHPNTPTLPHAHLDTA